MTRSPAWLRAMAIGAAALCAMATSLPPAAYVRCEPDAGPFLERDGLLVYIEPATTMARLKVDTLEFEAASDHLHLCFIIKNSRNEGVTLSTAAASLLLDQATTLNAIPTHLRIEPGATVRIALRFNIDLRDHRELLRDGIRGRLRLGDAGPTELSVPVRCVVSR